MLTREAFLRAQNFEDTVVDVRLKDGSHFRAKMPSLTEDLDGSRHLFYDPPIQASHPHVSDAPCAYYVSGEEIVSIERAE